MALNDVYEVSLLGSVKGEKVANVIHFREVTDPTVDNEIRLAEAVYDDIWTGKLRAALSNDYTLQQIRCRRIHPTAGGPIIKIVDEAGSVAVDTLPPNTFILVRFYTNVATRRGRGRILLCGIPKSHVQNGIMMIASVTLYNDVAAAFMAQLNESGGDWQPCVWSRSGTVSHDIIEAQALPTAGTLRGRRMAAP